MSYPLPLAKIAILFYLKKIDFDTKDENRDVKSVIIKFVGKLYPDEIISPKANLKNKISPETKQYEWRFRIKKNNTGFISFHRNLLGKSSEHFVAFDFDTSYIKWNNHVSKVFDESEPNLGLQWFNFEKGLKKVKFDGIFYITITLDNVLKRVTYKINDQPLNFYYPVKYKNVEFYPTEYYQLIMLRYHRNAEDKLEIDLI